MDSYGWKIKTWNFNKDNIEQKRKEMFAWCENGNINISSGTFS